MKWNDRKRGGMSSTSYRLGEWRHSRNKSPFQRFDLSCSAFHAEFVSAKDENVKAALHTLYCRQSVVDLQKNSDIKFEETFWVTARYIQAEETSKRPAS